MKEFVACVLLATFSGCAMPHSGATIPIGEWSGEGVYVGEKWAGAESTPAISEPSRPRNGHGAYHTTLSIRPENLDGHNVFMLQIDSEHVGDPFFEGEANRLRVALAEGKRASDSCVLYRVVGTLYNPKTDEAMHYKDPGPVFAASCMSMADETVLVLNYETGFVDTFCFRGLRLDKAGALQEKDSIIHWTEQLRLRRLSR